VAAACSRPGCRARGGWEDQAARTAFGVRRDLRDLRDVPDLGGLAELALADRPGIRVGERDEAVGDLLAANTLDDLLGDLLATIGELVALGGRAKLRLGAAPARLAPGGRRESPRFPN